MLRDADEGLAARLPCGVLREVAPGYLEEPRGRWRGRAGLIAAPRTVDEVSAVLGACHAVHVPVVPRGGGTGLVAGAVAPEGALPLVLSLERMQAVRGIWPQEGVLCIEAGATLAAARAAAEAEGLVFPLALASSGSAQIGGVLATNAGGVNVLRYGNARALCLGVEAVLPDGRVLRDLKRLRKDNTGFDIRDLLIGSEGCLGVITAATLHLVRPPAGQAVALMQVSDPAAALRLLALAQGRLAGCVSAFELISGQGLRFLAEALPDLRQPFESAPDWMVLIEAGLPAGMNPDVAMSGLYEAALAEDLVGDALIAQTGAQAADFWRLREEIPTANRLIGSISSHDISLPLSEISDFIRDAGAMIAGMGDMRVNCFGHLGDGNLHYNVFPARGRKRAEYGAMQAEIQERVHALTVARGGSFSAEHGVGRLKTGELARWGDPVRLEMMRAIKAQFDPHGIMNPGAVLAG